MTHDATLELKGVRPPFFAMNHPSDATQTLIDLLDDVDSTTDLVHRHLWLIEVLDWIRGSARSADASAARVTLLLDTLDARPRAKERVQQLWGSIATTVDASLLLCDYGFASRNAFVSEFIERLHKKILPASPETIDAAELFGLCLHQEHDAQWIALLQAPTLGRLAQLLTLPAEVFAPESGRALTHWQRALVDAITYCTSQIRAAGFSPELRLRMHALHRESNPFQSLDSDFSAVRRASQNDDDLAQAVAHFKARLDACRQAAASVYGHLDANGVSMDLVFRLRQLRERVLRIRLLLDCLMDDEDHTQCARLISQLASLGQSQQSLRALVTYSSSILAAKVAESSSETGEHYITRNLGEYRTMLGQAAGGGALTAFTTALKFGVMAIGLSAFWFGFWAGVVYAVSFVAIQLCHFTLATKQPAMTAPAMAAKLQDVTAYDSTTLAGFVDEVSHLVRSQIAAVLGNVVVVFPATILLAVVYQWVSASPMIDAAHAGHVFESLVLWGPSVLFAAFTGVLLFFSSLIGGWAENWFVLHRLDSAIRYNPRITRYLGASRANRWAHFLRHNISGLYSNISLGFMLGLVPSIMGFFGIGLDVRHVTLSAGQLGAACASLGWSVVYNPALWWAVATIPFIGALNLTVSFYLAFRVALQARSLSRSARAHVRAAIFQRLRQAPLSFFWPRAAADVQSPAVL